MNEIGYTLFILNELKEEWYAPPSSYYIKRNLFDTMSYSRWAIDEIKRAVRKHPYRHPLDSIEEFRYEMEKHACETTSESVNYIFSIAVDVAIDVLDVLRAQHI